VPFSFASQSVQFSRRQIPGIVYTVRGMVELFFVITFCNFGLGPLHGAYCAFTIDGCAFRLVFIEPVRRTRRNARIDIT
jgi:hypothetical protein